MRKTHTEMCGTGRRRRHNDRDIEIGRGKWNRKKNVYQKCVCVCTRFTWNDLFSSRIPNEYIIALLLRPSMLSLAKQILPMCVLPSLFAHIVCLLYRFVCVCAFGNCKQFFSHFDPVFILAAHKLDDVGCYLIYSKIEHCNWGFYSIVLRFFQRFRLAMAVAILLLLDLLPLVFLLALRIDRTINILVAHQHIQLQI